MFSFLNNIPQVTRNLLIINVLLYLSTMLILGMNGLDISYLLGAHALQSPVFEPFQIVTHMFMHSSGDIFHIFMNMFILVMFGPILERVWGAKHFFIFYIACGLGAFVVSSIAQTFEYNDIVALLQARNINIDSLNNAIRLFNPNTGDNYQELFGPMISNADENAIVNQYIGFSLSPGVGASGAIFGLLAGFAILFPNTELQLLFIPVPIKAKYLIGAYVAYEAYKAFVPTIGDHTNHWAHIGGAITGAIIVLARRKTNHTNFY